MFKFVISTKHACRRAMEYGLSWRKIESDILRSKSVGVLSTGSIIVRGELTDYIMDNLGRLITVLRCDRDSEIDSRLCSVSRELTIRQQQDITRWQLESYKNNKKKCQYTNT